MNVDRQEQQDVASQRERERERDWVERKKRQPTVGRGVDKDRSGDQRRCSWCCVRDGLFSSDRRPNRTAFSFCGAKDARGARGERSPRTRRCDCDALILCCSGVDVRSPDELKREWNTNVRVLVQSWLCERAGQTLCFDCDASQQPYRPC